jgi:diguanylate cyclase (GGDEF)-like protein
MRVIFIPADAIVRRNRGKLMLLRGELGKIAPVVCAALLGAPRRTEADALAASTVQSSPARDGLASIPVWALLLLFVLLVLGPAFHRWRLRLAERRAADLERLVAERTEALARANAELAEKNAQLTALSTTDALTGLANRRSFDHALDLEWRRSVRAGTWLSLAIVDIDAFKLLNDTLGHPAGDACLARLGVVLKRAANRSGELAARLGGEEFALLLPDTSPDAALIVAERTRDDVLALRHEHPSSPVAPVVTVSIGVATVRPAAGADPEGLVHAADEALYDAKRSGRNRCVSRIGLASSAAATG